MWIFFADQLKQKLHVLDDLNPRCIDDFLPLISMDAKKLHQFKKTLEELELDESNENPIYYFSEKLKVIVILKMYNEKS